MHSPPIEHWNNMLRSDSKWIVLPLKQGADTVHVKDDVAVENNWDFWVLTLKASYRLNSYFGV